MASAGGDNTRKGGGTIVKSLNMDSDDAVSIDLTDPEDVLEKLTSLDLDEKETDELLKRAYDVNLELKKQLELGRLVMGQRMSSSKENSDALHSVNHKRPGSNMININVSPDQTVRREQTRMASATQSAHGHSRHGKVGLSNLVAKSDHPLRKYSYHSYTE